MGKYILHAVYKEHDPRAQYTFEVLPQSMQHQLYTGQVVIAQWTDQQNLLPLRSYSYEYLS